MRKFIRKLISRKGDSFAEILIAILIAALGCMLVATMYSSAMNMNLDASEKDDKYYSDVTEMEQLFDSEGTRGHVNITEDDGGTCRDSIWLYGDEDNAAYRRK